ncbi:MULTISPECIES: DUF2512 family protein [Terrilactibacillus]|uniref:DUF2512 family protein n=2 Tax=Terrilactibacillus TaxID=1795633 RepID=A0A6N8CS08_9BACI|nr:MULTISPECIES: DUF2512 family protein [Terrilactibacillus]MTT32831.1 DUF2512 family protein [Terrilactibacillus tamarindi]
MDHVKALLIKFIANLVILIFGLIYNASFSDVFLTI